MCQRTDRRVRGAAERGFTLIELMVVIVILGLLIGLVGVNVGLFRAEGEIGAARAQMHNFDQAINFYKMRKKSLPRSLDDLTQEDDQGRPYMDKIPNDPWGQPYAYRVLDERKGKFEIRSGGEDRTMDTTDDVLWPEPETK